MYSSTDHVEDPVGVGFYRPIKDGHQASSRVFGVKVDLTRRQRFVANHRPAEVETTIHKQIGMGLNHLRRQFAKNELLREILTTNANRFARMVCSRYQTTSERRVDAQRDKKQRHRQGNGL